MIYLELRLQIGRSKRIINSNKWGPLKQDVEADKSRTFENSTYRTRWTDHVERIFGWNWQENLRLDADVKEKDKTFVEIGLCGLVAWLRSPTPETSQFCREVISVTWRFSRTTCCTTPVFRFNTQFLVCKLCYITSYYLDGRGRQFSFLHTSLSSARSL